MSSGAVNVLPKHHHHRRSCKLSPHMVACTPGYYLVKPRPRYKAKDLVYALSRACWDFTSSLILGGCGPVMLPDSERKPFHRRSRSRSVGSLHTHLAFDRSPPLHHASTRNNHPTLRGSSGRLVNFSHLEVSSVGKRGTPKSYARLPV